MFQDRTEAGRRLAEALQKFRDKKPVVLGIPRGGVLVAAEVSRALGAPLDLIIPRKIGAPGNAELGIGAIAGEGLIFINEQLTASLNVPQDYIDKEAARQLEEIGRRRRLYLGDRRPMELTGRTVLIVDDGLATGYTALAAVNAVKNSEPAEVVLAVPVAPPETAATLGREVDELVCLATPEAFFAVGQFYAEFHQVTDEEVIEVLKRHGL